MLKEANKCSNCGRPIGDFLSLCKGCYDELTQAIMPEKFHTVSVREPLKCVNCGYANAAPGNAYCELCES